jgi:hypothetical protein
MTEEELAKYETVKAQEPNSEMFLTTFYLMVFENLTVVSRAMRIITC